MPGPNENRAKSPGSSRHQAKTTFITGYTDASIYNNHGIEMAVVGIGARDEHSTEEHIHVADMEKALAMLIEILRLSAV